MCIRDSQRALYVLCTCSVRALYVLCTCSVEVPKIAKIACVLRYTGIEIEVPLLTPHPSLQCWCSKPSNSISTLKRGCGLSCKCLVGQCYRSSYAFHYAFQALAIKTVDSAYFQEITHLLRFQFPPTVGFLPHLSFKNWGEGHARPRSASQIRKSCPEIL